MSPISRRISSVVAGLSIAGAANGVGGCKRSEPAPDLVKTQRESMERAKDVGKTMQKGVDEQGRKADEEGK